jgi:stage IV sporulation protein B
LDGITKGQAGKPGELRGRLESGNLGKLSANTACGVFGIWEGSKGEKALPIGLKEEVQCKEATILCSLNQNGKKEYTVRIEEILDQNRSTKNFILRVTDPALLEQTGGIVQGMSGSPILQDGKIIGAVTHVLVNDPTLGYGIFIENMLETANTVAKEQEMKEAS